MKHQRISEFAAVVGVSHTAIRKAINAGRIPTSLIKTKELPSGRKITLITDPHRARAAFLANSHRDITGADTPVDDVLDDRPEVADSAGGVPASVSRRVWDADEVAQMVHEEYHFARKVLLAIPTRVAESVAACADAKQCHAIIEGAISDALDDLASDIDQYYTSDVSDIEPETSTSSQLRFPSP